MNTVFVISALSGTGKTTMANQVLALDNQLARAVSYTTRSPRPDEKEGNDYHFVSPSEFVALKSEGFFLETAEVYGHYYGTSKQAVSDLLKGKDVLLVIDVQGAFAVNDRCQSVVKVFILPPSYEALLSRLNTREEQASVINHRLSGLESEVSSQQNFDYLIVNEHLDEAVADLRAIIRVERLKSSRDSQAIADLYQALLHDARKS